MPSRRTIIVALIFLLFGIVTVVVVVLSVAWAAEKSSDTFRVIVAGAIAALASPLAVEFFKAAWKAIQLPTSTSLRQEAEATKRLERVVRDLEAKKSETESIEATRAQIEAFVEVRTRKLDLERRTESWQSEARRLQSDLLDIQRRSDELNEDKDSMITPEARQVLEQIVEPSDGRWDTILDLFGYLAPWPVSGAVAFLNGLVGLFRS